MSSPSDAAEILAAMAAEFVDLARAMADGGNHQLVGNRVVAFAAQAVQGSEHSALTVASGNQKPTTQIASGDLPLRVDALQYELNEGPGLQALVQSDVAMSGDLATSKEWPAFGPRAAAETGIHSMLSMRLFLTGDHRAALNFYSSHTDAFDDASVATAAIFASYASLVQLNSIHQDNEMHLVRALESNREIGVAIGILMARHLHTPEKAFHHLREASQGLHRKLHDIAREVTETGALPEYPKPRAD